MEEKDTSSGQKYSTLDMENRPKEDTEEYFLLHNAHKDSDQREASASEKRPGTSGNIDEPGSADDPDDSTEPSSCWTSFREWRRTAEDRQSWFVLFAVVVPVNVLFGMEIVSFSIYYVEYANYFFNNSRFAIGAIVAIKSAMTSFTGIFTSVLINRYSCRVVSMAAGALMFTSLLLSSFANNIVVMHVTQGFLLGVGCSFCTMSLNVITQKSFKRNRALAGGVEMLGITVGSMSGTYLIDFLLREYSWKGTVRIQGALLANVIPLSLLMPRQQARTVERPESRQPVTKKVSQFLKDMFDFSLFRNALFSLIAFGVMLQRFNGQIVLQHITSRAVYLGMTRTKGANVLVAATVGIVICRIIITFTANLKCSKRIVIFAIGAFIGGISSFLIVVLKSFWGQALGSMISGVHIGMTNTIFTVILVDVLGIDLLPRALALCHVLLGITNLLSTPIGGLLYDVTGDYDPTFLMAGTCGILSGMLVLIAVVLDRRRKKKRRSDALDRDIKATDDGTTNV